MHYVSNVFLSFFFVTVNYFNCIDASVLIGFYMLYPLYPLLIIDLAAVLSFVLKLDTIICYLFLQY